MRLLGIVSTTVIAALMLALPATSLAARGRPARDGLQLERVVIVMRHGVRAPLSGEVPSDTRTAQPWPRWPVADGQLTPHGAAALRLLARHDRRWLASLGLARCPVAGTVRIWTNTAERTIASGEAYAAGFAPGCLLPVGHLAADQIDPRFEPLRAGATAFDPNTAIASINRYTGGMAALVQRHQPTIDVLNRILGCDGDQACSPATPATLAPAADGRGVDLTGPIRATSGIAQVLLLAEAEGMPRSSVGWGHADPATIARIGTLHAALFDVFTRSPYMASHQASVLGHHIIDTLRARSGPRLEILVGHDTNVTALAAAMSTDLDAPGFARNDVAPGGALVFERLRDRRSGVHFVRIFYRTQALGAIRSLKPNVTITPLSIAGCTTRCRADRFAELLGKRLPPLLKGSGD
ncbi:histidine-type phosphatase [Sphingomonas sp. RB3P16]|uniref:histidine-type phosphatase n=1 Tax=Parasphingomonas frigoris TaxID=3096163 RepID=UPI002FCAE24F